MQVMKILCGVFVGILIITLVSAQLTFVSETVPRNLTGGQLVTGQVVLKSTNHPGDTLMTSSYPHNRTTLLSWIQQAGLVEGVDYTCSIPGCQTRTRANVPLGNSFSLSSNVSFLFGFNITKQESVLESFALTLSTDAPASCATPFTLTIGSDRTLVSSAYQPDLLCGEVLYGCFNRDLNSLYSLVEITPQGVCSRMELPSAPAFVLGARIQNTSTSESTLSMKVYRNNTEFVGACTLPTLTEAIQNVRCTLNQSLRADSYYVCVSAEQADSIYQIQVEETLPVCGTAELGGQAIIDFEIFAQPYGYAAPLSTSVHQAFQSQYGQALSEYLDDALANTYGRDCSRGCTIPFALQGSAQEVTIQSASTRYSSNGLKTTSTTLYTAEQHNPAITGNLTLPLAPLGIRAPSNAGTQTFTLKAGSSTLVTLPLSVTGSFAVQLQPRTYFAGVPMTLALLSPENISSVVWTFGDGQTATTTGGIVQHTYTTSLENVSLSVVARSARGREARETFILTSADPHSTLSTLLNYTAQRVTTLRSSLNALPNEISTSFISTFALENISAQLTLIRSRSYNDTTIGEPIAFLSGLSLPQRVSVSTTGSVPLDIYYTSLDSTYVSLIYDNITLIDPAEVKLNIIEWIGNRFTGTAQYQHMSTFENEVPTPYAVTYLLTLTRTEFAQDTLLIVDFPLSEVLNPPQDARPLVDDTHNGFAIPLAGKESLRLTFMGEPDLTQLGMFIIPDEPFFAKYAQVHEKKVPFPTVWFGIAWFVWLIGFLIVYVALQEWYKRHYEHYLFRNVDDLYNVITFLYNGRIQGTEEQAIRKKLAQSGWTGEQLTYALRKLDGKRTGMWEIPLFAHWEHTKIQQEVAKRRSGGGR
ncbi:hypothetical protein EXS73_03755 [Candidatus Pacearchaeota archaeon]|nr:hypothetical protein [Candidatus Pacearchaeota archaeon]